MSLARIVLVIPSLERGGAERVLSILANAWASDGRIVTILILNRGSMAAYPLSSSVTLENLGLPSQPANNSGIKLLRLVLRVAAIRKAIRKSKPDIVISFLDRTNVLTLLATRGLGVPVIVSERCDPRQNYIGGTWEVLRRIAYKWADALVCQTDASLSWFFERIKVRGYVIPNPVMVPQECSIKKKLDGQAQLRTILAMGRLTRQKGFDLLIDAFAQIAGNHPDWVLKIAGIGPLYSELMKQIEALGLGSRIYFLGEVADSYSLLRAADLFVLSSRFEGFPNVLCEAMACGLPVISFDCIGPREIIRHNIDGILVPPEDIAALAAIMNDLINKPEERQRLAARAPEVIDRFSKDKVLLLWEQLFSKVQKAI
ncbi:MAG TPA: glycosyltransferase family 4 protein [Candidatus Angelobacter sp.]|nr:glycosyltransferase family 4 protein [Candidatus Angelobacter sp.]